MSILEKYNPVRIWERHKKEWDNLQDVIFTLALERYNLHSPLARAGHYTITMTEGSLPADRAVFISLPAHLQDAFGLQAFRDISEVRTALRILASETRIMAQIDAVAGNMPHVP